MRDAVVMQKARKTLVPEHSACMFDLGVTLLHSGIMFDKPGDLDEAIAVLEAVKRGPDSSANRAAILPALGNAR